MVNKKITSAPIAARGEKILALLRNYDRRKDRRAHREVLLSIRRRI